MSILTVERKDVCGRLQVSQVNRIIPIPPQPHSRLYRIAIALGLTILVAQGNDVRAMPRAPFVSVVITDSPFVKQEVTDSTTGIKGFVSDKHKEPLINASVKVLQGAKLVATAITDYNGEFKITNIAPGTYTIEVALMGYISTVLQNIVVVEHETTTIAPKLSAGEVMGKMIYNPKLRITDDKKKY